jgi:putative SOS response-associated peptidase YedK
MCVRYTLHRPDAAIATVAKALGIRLNPEDWMETPRYNVAPSQIAPVVQADERVPRLRPMRWGFIPPADRALPRQRLLTNARFETLARLPAFRAAAAARRCLVPVNGFYEYKDLGSRKQPYVFMRPDEEPFVLAGLWEPPLGDLPPSFCVVTTAPNAALAGIHDRMPLVLTGPAMGLWLGDRPLEAAALRQLMQPLPADLVVARPVNAYANNSRHEGPQCLAPPDTEPPEFDFGH